MAMIIMQRTINHKQAPLQLGEKDQEVDQEKKPPMSRKKNVPPKEGVNRKQRKRAHQSDLVPLVEDMDTTLVEAWIAPSTSLHSRSLSITSTVAIMKDTAVNSLLNGSKEYNKRRRTRTSHNRRKRKKMNNRRNPGIGYRPVVPIERAHRSIFDEGDRTKMPLIVFGSGLQGREQVRFPGLQHGASNVIYKHLKVKEKQGYLCLLDIDEFKTSKVCNSCRQETLDYLIAADGQTIHAILNLQQLQYLLRIVTSMRRRTRSASLKPCGRVRQDLLNILDLLVKLIDKAPPPRFYSPVQKHPEEVFK